MQAPEYVHASNVPPAAIPALLPSFPMARTTLWVPSAFVPHMIGVGGGRIRNMERKSGCKIDFQQVYMSGHQLCALLGRPFILIHGISEVQNFIETFQLRDSTGTLNGHRKTFGSTPGTYSADGYDVGDYSQYADGNYVNTVAEGPVKQVFRNSTEEVFSHIAEEEIDEPMPGGSEELSTPESSASEETGDISSDREDPCSISLEEGEVRECFEACRKATEDTFSHIAQAELDDQMPGASEEFGAPQSPASELTDVICSDRDDEFLSSLEE